MNNSVVSNSSEWTARYPGAYSFWNLEHYEASGITDVIRYLVAGQRHGFPKKRSAALDVGCGDGRLTQALCRYFWNCAGIDPAPDALKLASARNRYPTRCSYLHRQEADFRGFDDSSFDLISAVAAGDPWARGRAEESLSSLVRLMSDGGLLVLRTTVESVPSAQPWAVSSTYEQALPIAAFRSWIGLDVNELVLRPGERVTLPVRLTNGSLTTWPASGRADGKYQVKLGNHWRTASDEMIVLDDGRATLPHDLAPGSETTVSLSITAPPAAGSYVLELDMVQELAGWFVSGGGRTCRIPVRVRDNGTAVRQPAALPEPVHQIPPGEMERLLHDCGATLIEVQDGGARGTEGRWQLCFVTKGEARQGADGGKPY
jgi:SAM-dependent methyltransferase